MLRRRGLEPRSHAFNSDVGKIALSLATCDLDLVNNAMPINIQDINRSTVSMQSRIYENNVQTDPKERLQQVRDTATNV